MNEDHRGPHLDWPNKTKHKHTHSFSYFSVSTLTTRFPNSKLFCLSVQMLAVLFPHLPVYTEGAERTLPYLCGHTDAAESQGSVNPGGLRCLVSPRVSSGMRGQRRLGSAQSSLESSWFLFIYLAIKGKSSIFEGNLFYLVFIMKHAACVLACILLYMFSMKWKMGF